MAAPRRTHAQARAEMTAGLLREGLAQLDEVGAAALSLREIARSLGVASSALYRHVASRDELLTLLIASSYNALADAVDSALAAPGPADARLRALGHAMRAWAVAYPRRWALLYGSPVPGYAAPAEGTTEAGTRVMYAFVRIVAGGEASSSPEPGPELGSLLGVAASDLGIAPNPATAAEAVGAWTGLVGTISAEVFGQLGPELTAHGAELLDRELARAAGHFGLS